MGSKNNVLNGVSWADTYQMFCILWDIPYPTYEQKQRFELVQNRLERYEDVAIERYEYTNRMLQSRYREISDERGFD